MVENNDLVLKQGKTEKRGLVFLVRNIFFSVVFLSELWLVEEKEN